MAEQLMGRHIVSDPRICHGKPTFRRTRILVSDVLEQIADGLAWETIIQEWHGSISREALAELGVSGYPTQNPRCSFDDYCARPHFKVCA